MPWTITKGGGTCPADQFAVIKSGDGSTQGCHPDMASAKKQLAALYVADKKKRSVSMGRTNAALLFEQERRGIPAATAELEIRAPNDDGSGGPSVDRFNGYAMTWGTRAAIGNPATVGFYEECSPGMLNKTLQEGDQRFLIDHNAYYVVSRVSADTLDLRTDGRGLPVDSALDDDLSYVRDLKANVRNKNITGMSFGFKVVKDDWKQERVGESDVEVRTLLEVQLIEVSAVTFPAYTKTQAELKSVATAMRSRVDLHGDLEAVERRAEFWPELPELCGVHLPRRTIIDLGSLTTDPARAEGTRDEPADDEAPCGCGDTDTADTQVDRDSARDVVLEVLRSLQPEDIRSLLEERSAISYQHTDTSDKPWDAGANEKNVPDDATARILRQVYAWVDPKGSGKSAYKFPHHFVSADGVPGAASTVACSAGIAALNGGRGGANVPTADRQGVWSHLAHHLKDAGMTPPALKDEMNSEPLDSTRNAQDDDNDSVEPAASTHTLAPSFNARMNALAARFHLPRTENIPA